MAKRNLKDYIFISLKGMAMGAADIVPGVSGGTIAFISGIYEELLSSISAVNISLFKTLKTKGFLAAYNQVNGNFLIALFGGILISILSLAKLIKWLLDHEPVLLWSFFFGLVVASILYVFKQITKWSFASVFLLLTFTFLAYYITTLDPLVSESTSYLFLFLAGAIAICAMILPGISGAFILVLLGAYDTILSAVNEKDIKVIATVGLGTFFGLLSFSKLLKWLFAHYRNLTLASLTGFIVGSLNKIWPWKETLTYRTNSEGIKVPIKQLSVMPQNFEGNPQLFFAIFVAIFGFLMIILLEKLAEKKS